MAKKMTVPKPPPKLKAPVEHESYQYHWKSRANLKRGKA